MSGEYENMSGEELARLKEENPKEFVKLKVRDLLEDWRFSKNTRFTYIESLFEDMVFRKNATKKDRVEFLEKVTGIPLNQIIRTFLRQWVMNEIEKMEREAEKEGQFKRSEIKLKS